MAEVNWTVSNLKRDAETGGVSVVDWQASVSTVDGSAFSAGAVRLTPDPSAPDFVPYEALTQDFVLHWVFSNVDRDKIEAGLQAEAQDDPQEGVAFGIPWGAE
jgi:hypothetical protein